MGTRVPSRNQGWRRSVLCRRLFAHRFVGQRCLLVRSLVALPLLLALAFVIVTQTPIMKWLVLPHVRWAIDQNVEAGRVHLALASGRIVLTDVRVSIPGVGGLPGRFVQVERLEAEMDWWTTITGNPRVRKVVATNPLVRISQSTVDGSLNLGYLPTPAGPGRHGPVELPEIQVHNAALELGEHDESRYRPLRRLNVVGTLSPRGSGANQTYELALMEGGEQNGLQLQGAVRPDGLSVRLGNVDLQEWTDSVPGPMRELIEELDLSGEVVETIFDYKLGEGVTARIVLSEGAMNLPVRADALPGQPVSGDLLRVTEVDGSIWFMPDGLYAEAAGIVGDLPTRVALNVDGLTLDSAFLLEFESTGFKLERNPHLLPYAPDIVREWLENFSNPTAMVDFAVEVARGGPTEAGAGEITYSGEISFREGSAAFGEFPYPFEDMSGLVRFDENRIDIVEISGVAASGATLLATGFVAPPTDDAEIAINVDVMDAPIDDALIEALGEERRAVVDVLFDREAHRRLVEEGLLLTSKQQRALGARLIELEGDPEAALERAEIVRKLDRPVFDLGGRINVTIDVHNPLGSTDWDTDIRIEFPTAGVLTSRFPIPVRAKDVLVQYDLSRATLLEGEFEGLRGGAASVNFTAELSGRFDPVIEIKASDVPADDLFVAALPDSDDPEKLSARKIVEGLGVGGFFDTNIRIVSRDSGDLGYDVVATFEGGSVSPAPRDAEDAIWVPDAAGSIRLNENELRISAGGTVVRTSRDGDRLGLPSGRIRAQMRVDLREMFDEVPRPFEATIYSDRADLAARAEDFVAVFSEETAQKLEEMRAKFNPEGVCDVITTVTRTSEDPEAPIETVVSVANADGLAFSALDGRFLLRESRGVAEFRIGEDKTLTLADMRVPVVFDGFDCGDAHLDGDVPIEVLAGEPFPEDAEESLDLSLDEGLLESPLSRRIVQRWFKGVAREWYFRSAPRGIFSVKSNLSSAGMAGRLYPKSLTFFRGLRDIEFKDVKGVVNFEKTRGSYVGLEGHAEEWSVRADGAWMIFAPGESSFKTTFSIDADRMNEEIRAALPNAVTAAIEKIDLKIDGPTTLRNGAFEYVKRGEDERRGFAEFTGDLTVQDASFRAGVQIDNCEGSTTIRVSKSPDSEGPKVEMDLKADRLRAMGLWMDEGSARILVNDTPGRIEALDMSANCHAGRFSGSSEVWEAPGDPAKKTFIADLRLANIEFGPALADFKQAAEEKRARERLAEIGGASMGVFRPQPDEGAEPRPETSDRSRGVLEGAIMMTGILGDDETRRGSGRFRIADGEIIDLPLIIPMLEVINLSLPGGSELDYATADFYIDGDTIALENVSAYSELLEIFGWGTVEWGSLDMDLRLFSRPTKPIPLIGPLLSGIRNELVSVSVSGRPGAQKMKLSPLQGTTNPRDRLGMGRKGLDGWTIRDEKRRVSPTLRPDLRSDRGIEPDR